MNKTQIINELQINPNYKENLDEILQDNQGLTLEEYFEVNPLALNGWYRWFCGDPIG